MHRIPPARTARDIAAAALLISGTFGLYGPASAESRKPPQSQALEQNTMAGPPVMAIVSVKDQNISLYDANGGTIRSKVSSGATGYETPVGTYSILEKNREHYSNIYDAASMPFMQRITWSGVALHQGVLPGYPASHGCVRLPQSYAEQIFPLTKIGMRVIVARDTVAPVEFSHPSLLQPAPLQNKTVATKTSFETQEPQETGSVFQADVRNWPERQAQMDALKAVAASKAAEAELTKGPVESLKTLTAAKVKERTAADKIFKAADKAFRIANDKAARANRDLAAAKDPANLTKAEEEKLRADEAVIKADTALASATLAANAAASGRERKKAERILQAATRARDKAKDLALSAERAVAFTKDPAHYKKEEETAAKAAAALSVAEKNKDDASAVLAAADARLAHHSQDVADATQRMNAAIAVATEARRKTLPFSLFVSLKTQRIYLRQGHQPVMDMPVAIADPARPIGTHVFTAVDYEKDGAEMRWTAVSLARRPVNEVAQLTGRYERQSDVAPEPFATNATIAAAALDRVTIPPEMLAHVSQSVWPGSSLIVSDEEASKETNNATDFVVLISGEPQGGIKKRPKPKPMPYFYYDGGSYFSSYSGPAYGWNNNPAYAQKYGSQYGMRYDRYGRPIRVKPKPAFSWW